MNQAYQEFMLHGHKQQSTTPVSSSSPSSSHRATTPASSSRKHGTRLSSQSKKLERKYWQIINAFQGTLQRDWIGVDDNLGQVMESISTLRRQIYLEKKFLMDLEEKASSSSSSVWSSTITNTTALTMDDVELALSQDLLQHEKMMAGARTLLSSLSQAQDALGRRLEEAMLHQEDLVEWIEDDDDDDAKRSLWKLLETGDTMKDIYIMAARELYRKQCSVQTVLDSVTDDLFPTKDISQSARQEGNPRDIAASVARSWSRSSVESRLDHQIVREFLGLGDASRKAK